MTEPPDQGSELGAEEQRLAERLQSARPVVPAGFRGALGRHLAARDLGYGPRPPRLRLISASYLVAGLVLMALGLTQALGQL